MLPMSDVGMSDVGKVTLFSIPIYLDNLTKNLAFPENHFYLQNNLGKPIYLKFYSLVYLHQHNHHNWNIYNSQ